MPLPFSGHDIKIAITGGLARYFERFTVRLCGFVIGGGHGVLQLRALRAYTFVKIASYFPIQNFEKILSSKSSVDMLPVISPR